MWPKNEGNSMKVIRISANTRELILDDHETRILISYSTPVAIRFPDGIFACTVKNWSPTTKRQISKWWGTLQVSNSEDSYWRNTIPQETLNELLYGTPLYDEIGQWKTLNSQKYPIKSINAQLRAK